MYLIGNITLILGAVLSLYAIIANIVGIKGKNNKWLESARGGVLAIAFTSSVATFLLLYVLGTSQFQYTYVASYTNLDLDLIYKLTAFWAGNAGSLLLWTFLLSIYAAVIVSSKKKQNKMIPYVSIILLCNLLFFFIVMLVTANPFEMSAKIPTDGKGLNPMLQNPGMVLHPVTLYLGYVGLSVPFAYAIAALLLKDMDATWIKLTRKWTLVAWLFLTLGNIVGAWWAYLELGWGGYWAWDPVENASFMPWLTVSAFLHSVMIQERKGMLRTWNLCLIILSYILTLFGTFLVRSGILTSVHAFGDGDLGNYFLIFMSMMLLFAIYVVASRYHLIKAASNPIDSYFSKESSFLLNNFILIVAAFAVFWGTMYPLISETITGTKINVGPPFFNKVMAPVFLALLILMAICPLISWQKAVFDRFVKMMLIPLVLAIVFLVVLVATGVKGTFAMAGLSITFLMFVVHIMEFWRGTVARRKATKENVFVAAARLTMKNQRRYGGYLVHIGIAVIAIGVISSHAYSESVMKTVSKGETLSIGKYDLTFKSLHETMDKGNGIVYAKVAATYEGKSIGTIRPEKIFYETWPEPSTEVSIKTNWKEDLYLVLSSWEDDDTVTFVVKVNPFVSWIWIGGIIMVLGTAVSLIGGRTTSFQSTRPVGVNGKG